MMRKVEQYAKCDPYQIITGSHAQVLYFMKDAKSDITELAEKVTVLEAATRECLAWVRHWKADVAGNLKPTQDSLAMVEAKILAALEAGE